MFSFVRYDPEFEGIDDPNRELTLLENACIIMSHEIGHMYGMKHCIYYECRMNGIMSYQESCRKRRYLCPVCHRKLQQNIKFVARDRFEQMEKVCKELGFEQQRKYYKDKLSK